MRFCTVPRSIQNPSVKGNIFTIRVVRNSPEIIKLPTNVPMKMTGEILWHKIVVCMTLPQIDNWKESMYRIDRKAKQKAVYRFLKSSSFNSLSCKDHLGR